MVTAYEFQLGDTRLLQLADHLTSSNHVLGMFDFNLICEISHLKATVSAGVDGSDPIYTATLPPEHPCGSCGCAIGELPLVFPDDFVYRLADQYGHKVEKISAAKFPRTMSELRQFDWATHVDVTPVGYAESTFEKTQQFFQLSFHQHTVLLWPCLEGQEEEKRKESYSVCQLDARATADDVANNLRTFVKARQAHYADTQSG